MGLDLDEVIADWNPPEDEVAARLITGRDGREQVQLRVDLGLLQMAADGRPDGGDYQGLPTALEYIQHELAVGGQLRAEDWHALLRELEHFNFRRVGLTALVESAWQAGQQESAWTHAERTLRDVQHCLRALGLIDQQGLPGMETNPALRPTLLFQRTQLLVRLRASQKRHEEAIEELEAGIDALDQTLADAGVDPEQREQDPAIRYLRELSPKLRERFGVPRTLREELADAIEREDFEKAATLRDALRRRPQETSTPPPPQAS